RTNIALAKVRWIRASALALIALLSKEERDAADTGQLDGRRIALPRTGCAEGAAADSDGPGGPVGRQATEANVGVHHLRTAERLGRLREPGLRRRHLQQPEPLRRAPAGRHPLDPRRRQQPLALRRARLALVRRRRAARGLPD